MDQTLDPADNHRRPETPGDPGVFGISFANRARMCEEKAVEKAALGWARIADQVAVAHAEPLANRRRTAKPGWPAQLFNGRVVKYIHAMTILDNFVAFARALPAEHRQEMEGALAGLMDRYDSRHDLTPSELGELHRRAADTAPQYAEPENIAEIFGKPFRS